MTLVALIHGGWHSGAHWDKLIPEIEGRGHRAVAMDLPCETGGVATYIDPVTKVIEDVRGSDDVVLVAHSMGGLTLPHVAERVGAKHHVYVCALLNKPGKTVTELIAEETDILASDLFDNTTNDGSGTFTWDPEAAKAFFYHDCSPQDAEWAASRLRAQYLGPGNDPAPIDISGSPATYVVCRDDRAVRPDWSRKRARDWLGIDPIEIDGSHSPFISRPGELADIIVSVA